MNKQFKNIPELEGLYLLQEKDFEKAADCNGDAYLDYELLRGILKDKFDYETIKKLWYVSIKS